MTAVVDDHRPLLAPDINYVDNDNDSDVLKKRNPSYDSVQTIAREETGTSGWEDSNVDEMDVEAVERNATNRRMAQLVSLCRFSKLKIPLFYNFHR